jgi:hypothetical protein
LPERDGALPDCLVQCGRKIDLAPNLLDRLAQRMDPVIEFVVVIEVADFFRGNRYRLVELSIGLKRVFQRRVWALASALAWRCSNVCGAFMVVPSYAARRSFGRSLMVAVGLESSCRNLALKPWISSSSAE